MIINKTGLTPVWIYPRNKKTGFFKSVKIETKKKGIMQPYRCFSSEKAKNESLRNRIAITVGDQRSIIILVDVKFRTWYFVFNQMLIRKGLLQTFSLYGKCSKII